MTLVNGRLEDCRVKDIGTTDGVFALRFEEGDPIGALVVEYERGRPPRVLLLDQAEASVALAEKHRPTEDPR